MWNILNMQKRRTNKMGTCESWQRTEEPRYGQEREREREIDLERERVKWR
jgi:hypothetical protein